MTTTTLFLVRHGTTALNDRNIFQGAIDEPLNALGLSQSQLLTEYFKDIPIDLAISSPLTRARQTLDFIVAERPEIPVIVDAGISEINGGVLEGRPFQELSVLTPEIIDALDHHLGRIDTRFYGGETGEMVYNRVRDTILNIIDAHLGKTLVMVSHGYALGAWINFVRGVPAAEMTPIPLENVSVCKFTFKADGNIRTDFIGDHHHLTNDARRVFDWEALTRPLPIFIHYPKCSTCKKARRFLDDHGVAYQTRDIVAEALRKEELLVLMNRYPGEDRRFFNTSGQLYRQQRLKDQVLTMDRDAKATKLAESGMLVKRPLLVFKDRVCIGFKEAEWRKALDLD
ncbi:transcriptional regulator, Spx/MgsR family [Pseudoramibacter alactolyticus ATCC 23263]|uniref:Transcriptional regulator, Spx/MgsR family n=1 Tax=Pseudoramibacter alactolyticus ATCC 23263 TaxID=887929 RepID=E6MG47_9FIRM|nr:Spx/MgsR family RNA polymerase-binding regulatory protein [Pseudoramibacter alactolyticus]EFV01587.1 transcriptional regulator, Spx/MgsR family [Pseudoramibacter alactolyticus ATCC 23263]